MASSLGGLETTLNDLLVKKAPFQLPKSAKDALVGFAPWLALIGGIFALLGALAVFGLGAFMPLMMYAGPAYGASFLSTWTISLLVLGVSGVLDLMAFPGLKAHKKSGWNLLFYGQLVWAVSALLQFSLFNLIVGTLVGLYLLFQIREYYK